MDHMLRLCADHPDPSHDILHVKRVVRWAKTLALSEKANFAVVIPAAYLHDCIYISKTDNRRSQASRLSADKAMSLLKDWGYPAEYLPAIEHAIATHSFSSGLHAETKEAQVVQDADRLDAMGAIGIFRCFAFSGLALRPLYNESDPFCTTREPNDKQQTLDHFFVKLLHLQEKLNTESAKREGEKRLQTMKAFLTALEGEIVSRSDFLSSS